MELAIRVITDSTANLEAALVKELGIVQVSLSVNFEDKSYLEIDISNEEFFSLMDKSPKVPTSSQPSPADFYIRFLEAYEAGFDIVGVFISADLSGTYSSALTARSMLLEKFPQARIELIDSRSAAMELGYAVLAAARAAKAGATIEEVMLRAELVMQRSHIYFAPQTLDYLKKGGRIGGAAALVGTLLQVKPILTIQEGKVAIFDKVRTMEKAINRLISELGADFQLNGVEEITVHHINSLDAARKVAALVKERFGLTATINQIGPVVGLHVGPGTLGLAYYVRG